MPVAPSKTNSSLRKVGRPILPSIGIGIICIFAIIIFIRINSKQISGIEFSPYSFSTRGFVYSWNVLTGKSNATLKLEPAQLACSAEITKHLTNSTTTPEALKRWDLVVYPPEYDSSFQQPDNPSVVYGEAYPLIAYLRSTLTRSDEWEGWSIAHPKLAKVLWPSIQQLAINHAYFVIPDLLRYAKTVPTQDELSKECERLSIVAATQLIAEALSEKNYSLAEDVLNWIDPSSPKYSMYSEFSEYLSQVELAKTQIPRSKSSN